MHYALRKIQITKGIDVADRSELGMYFDVPPAVIAPYFFRHRIVGLLAGGEKQDAEQQGKGSKPDVREGDKYIGLQHKLQGFLL